ncbi:hypothetical protein MNV49_000606 [Pseudohyphozyma bogoriensis]|nr:hypothetical protein MNV49_000606 [Pseudohyphozyma bogoriensis]
MSASMSIDPELMEHLWASLNARGGSQSFVDAPAALAKRCLNQYSLLNNAQGLNPCQVVRALADQCHDSADYYSLFDLQAAGDNQYPPLSLRQKDECLCTMPAFNLIAACAACQFSSGEGFFRWQQYTANCSNPTLGFPYLTSVAVPAWAWIDNSYSGYNLQQATSVTNSESSGADYVAFLGGAGGDPAGGRIVGGGSGDGTSYISASDAISVSSSVTESTFDDSWSISSQSSSSTSPFSDNHAAPSVITLSSSRWSLNTTAQPDASASMTEGDITETEETPTDYSAPIRRLPLKHASSLVNESRNRDSVVTIGTVESGVSRNAPSSTGAVYAEGDDGSLRSY